MGLPIARHLVEAHGGRLEITSRGEGQGATVTVFFPALRDRAHTTHNLQHHELAPASARRRYGD